MKNITEILRILTNKRLKKVELLNEITRGKKDNYYYQFYKGVKSGKFQSDKDASLALYQSQPTDIRYQQLKSRFRKRLLNNLFFLDPKKQHTSEYSRAYYECTRDAAIIRILLNNGAKGPGIKMARQLIKKAVRYKFADIVINFSSLIRDNYSLLGDEKKYNYYCNLLRQHMQMQQAELLAEEYFQRVRINFAKTVTAKLDVKQISKRYYQELKAISNENDSFMFRYYMFKVGIMSYQISNDYAKALEICEQAEQYLDDNPPFNQVIRKGLITLDRMFCYLCLRDYKNGYINAQKCLGYFIPGSNNWFIFLESYFLLCMQTGNYKKAYEIFNMVNKHPRAGKPFPVRMEKWKIYEAYLHFIMELNPDEMFPESLYPERKFQVWQILRVVPEYSKDKRGYNVMILIVQILFLLIRKDFDQIISKAEALKTYTSRHLKKDEAYRSNCFIKMLLVMEKKSFDYELTRRLTHKYYEKLTNHQMTNDLSASIMEVIPYERLWEYILEELRISEEAH